MKLRFASLLSKKFTTRVVVVSCAVLMAVTAPLSLYQTARADKFDDQIRALQQQAAEYQAQANALRAQADTLANAVQQLGVQKAGVQSQIDLSQAQFNQLQDQIAVSEQKIKVSKDALGTTIADLYVDDTITPLEMLASSKNIGDYVDKQTYQSSIRDTLTQTIATIKALKVKLEVDKKNVEEVLAKQTAQRNSLASIEAEQQRLLDQTRGEEAAYQQQVANAKSQLEAVSAQQRAYYQSLLSSAGGGRAGVVGSFQYTNWSGNRGCSGGYAYCGAQDTYSDPWGLFNRECVSYVAWALANRFNKYVGNFSGEGNAWEWAEAHEKPDRTWNPVGSAISYSGATRVYTPQPGDVVILPQSGSFAPIGHAMIVDSVDGEWMHVSQYNFYGTGEYSTMDVKNSGVALLRFHN